MAASDRQRGGVHAFDGSVEGRGPLTEEGGGGVFEGALSGKLKLKNDPVSVVATLKKIGIKARYNTLTYVTEVDWPENKTGWKMLSKISSVNLASIDAA